MGQREPTEASAETAADTSPVRSPGLGPTDRGPAPGPNPSAAAVLRLQRAVGNRVTARALAGRANAAARTLARAPEATETVDLSGWLEKGAWKLIHDWRVGDKQPSAREIIAQQGLTPAEGLLKVDEWAAWANAHYEKVLKREATEDIRDAEFVKALIDDIRAEYLLLASPQERIQVIMRQLRPNANQGDWFLSGAQEKMILDVIAQAPASQSPELMALMAADGNALLKRLDHAFDGEVNVRYWKAIAPHMVRNSLAQKLPTDDNGVLQVPRIPWSRADGRYVYDIDWVDNNAVRIKVQEKVVTLASDAPEREVVYEGTLAPGDIVCVHFVKDDSELGGKAGENWFVPAVALHLFYNRAAKADLIRNLQVIGMVFAAVGVVEAVGVVATIVESVQLAIAASSLIVDQYREEIGRTEAGQTFLEYFDFVQTVAAVVGFARLVRAPKLLRKLTDSAWKLTESGEFDMARWTALNERMQRIRVGLNEADRAVAADAAAAARTTAQDTGGAPAVAKLHTPEEAAQAVENLENTATPIGKGLRRLRVFLDIDEPTAVSKQGAWDDPANKRFLERTTNQLTKNDLSEFAAAPPPLTQPISLAQAEANGPAAFKAAADQMLVRRFSDIEELTRITQDARAAMTNVNRPVGSLRSAINRAIRQRIRLAATPDAARVARALRVAGIDPEGLSALPDPLVAQPPDPPRVRVGVDPPKVRVDVSDPPRVRVGVPEEDELPPDSHSDPADTPAKRRMRVPSP